MTLPPDVLARVQAQAANPGLLAAIYLPPRIQRKLNDDGFRGKTVSPCPQCRHGERAVGLAGVQWVRRCCGRPL